LAPAPAFRFNRGAMRLLPAIFSLATALTLAACAADGPGAANGGAIGSGAADAGAAATPDVRAGADDVVDAPLSGPVIVRKAGGAPAAAPTPEPARGAPPEADAEPVDALALFKRMFGALGGSAPPAEPAAAAPAPPAPAPVATLKTEDAGAAVPPPSSPPPGREIAALAPPGPGRPPPPPPLAGPARPNPAACADVTADGPAKEVDLDKVRVLLRGVDYRRGAFETNASYRGRLIAKLENVEDLAIEQTGRADLVFSLPIAAYRLNYDADAKELWVGSDLGLLRGGSAIGMGDFILVSSAERRVGTHVGVIAYGASHVPGVRREVTRITGDQLGLILPGGTAMGWPANFQRLHVPMSPAEAARAQGALAVLFVGRLQEPYFVTGEFLQEAKLDEPVEKRLAVEAIKLSIDCAALYDRRSGRLIQPLVPPPGR
jgi:hypothetical protein